MLVKHGEKHGKLLEIHISLIICLANVFPSIFLRELEHNNLTEVNKGWLYGLRTLQQLFVSQNAINKISPDAWEFCQRLAEL